MKKIISILLAVCLVMTMLPTVFAADVVEVDTETALKNAVNNGGEIKLTKNIVLISYLPISKDVTIDLNGFTISRNNGEDTSFCCLHF